MLVDLLKGIATNSGKEAFTAISIWDEPVCPEELL